ncbi:MAG: TonB-dependent receptor [Saprospiraceae bacterium]|nr:TonB-dependent receptor [Saprospiraceae bacterium]
MRNFILPAIGLLLLFATSLSAQQRLTVSGEVRDAADGETLIGATVAITALGIGATTNEYGFYSLTLPATADSVTLEFSYVGYQTAYRTVLLQAGLVVNVELGAGVQIEEVVVKANSFREKMRSTEMSVEEISVRQAKLLPVLLGESDIIKAIQLKPGIPSGSEGTTGLFVRGGGADQNLILLDEAVVYNASHLFGFFSTFNTDAVKDLKLYKGGFPAQYGGRLSSVIDVKLKEGNAKKFAATGGIGLIASRLTLEGPIQKDKSSFMVSGRRTYFDLITRGINAGNKDNPDYSPIPDYYFYDLNTKINYKLGEKDHLYVSGYFGRDKFGFDGDFFDFTFDWGNATGTARWNHVFNPRLFANTTFTYSDYQYNIRNKVTGFSFDLSSRIEDATLKSDLYYAVNPKHTLRFGAAVTSHNFRVGRLQAGNSDGSISFSSGQNFRGVEGAVYVSDELELSERAKLNSGLRLSGFTNGDRFYGGLEPRAALRYLLSSRLTAKASYARMYQYLHLIANAGVSLPTDVWYPSTSRVPPQRSDQVALGVSYLLGEQFMINVETYYKYLQNQIEFVDGARLFANNDLEDEFALGRGDAYGFELSLEKEAGRLNGWIGYTLAWARRGDFTTLSPGRPFSQQGFFRPVYDRRHDLSVVLFFDLSRKLDLTATWVYGSGDLRWLPAGRFTFQDVPGASFQAVVPDYLDRNTYRLPSYHRLDLGLVLRFYPKRGESDLTFNIINAYDRRNTFFIYLEPEFNTVTDVSGNEFEVPKRIAAKQVSLFPILPSITYNFKF